MLYEVITDFAAVMTRLGFTESFDALSAEDQNRVWQNAKRSAQERRFDRFIASLRDRYPVRIHPERLAAVPWPPPRDPGVWQRRESYNFV